MKIKIKKLDERFKMPTKGSSESACYDCYATSYIVNGKKHIYGLGFACEPPEGYSVELRPRSSISNHGLSLTNSIGTVDADYRGELIVKFYECDDFVKPYQVGERVCQMKLVRDYQEDVMLVDELSETIRGDGGFGSTGLK